ncbi:hypothetical protein [Enterovibrio norvegicus]|uniref:hypothetical protein n=1 Tax=Enterovibrio norvegicus TaxID=188144 RepID=UPI000C86025A|nr:hypothetical protein [Enterovibrio norvegicus]PML81832.1 hypothetical protein BCT69_00370 [Enterovibrio norvegicus]PMN72127.1 hypothetical protein BCT27_14840 [Enterovibrio norvegicus]
MFEDLPNKKPLFIVSAILLIAMIAMTLSSYTYSSKIYTIQIQKQHEKMLKDPTDAKLSDLVGLADVCEDIRFTSTLSFHLSNEETFSVQRACEDIKTRLRMTQFSDQTLSMRR